jgi:purine-binding chemotaxis protein CheW
MANETYVLFELAGADYALRSQEIGHIEMLEHVTPVPNTSAAVEGVVFSRGQVIPAINLRVRFGFPRQEHTMRTRMIIAQKQQRSVALIVDAAREFRAIPDEAIRPIEQAVAGINGNYLRGVASVNNRLVLLLDLDAVLSLPSLAGPAELVPELSSQSKTPNRMAAPPIASPASSHA